MIYNHRLLLPECLEDTYQPIFPKGKRGISKVRKGKKGAPGRSRFFVSHSGLWGKNLEDPAANRRLSFLFSFFLNTGRQGGGGMKLVSFWVGIMSKGWGWDGSEKEGKIYVWDI